MCQRRNRHQATCYFYDFLLTSSCETRLILLESSGRRRRMEEGTGNERPCHLLAPSRTEQRNVAAAPHLRSSSPSYHILLLGNFSSFSIASILGLSSVHLSQIRTGFCCISELVTAPHPQRATQGRSSLRLSGPPARAPSPLNSQLPSPPETQQPWCSTSSLAILQGEAEKPLRGSRAVPLSPTSLPALGGNSRGRGARAKFPPPPVAGIE